MPLIVSRRGGRIVPSRRGGLGVPRAPLLRDDKSGGEKQSSPPRNTVERADFDPDLDDVLAVKDLLKDAGNLPDEIALMILDDAEYWACSSTTIDYTNLPQKHLLLRGTQTENQFLVRSEPLGMTNWSPDDQEAWRLQAIPREIVEEFPHEKLQRYVDERLQGVLENPCRKIVFKIQSSDQGWGGNHEDRGTYKGSWTWFDAGIERFDALSESTTDVETPRDEAEIPVSALRPIWPLTTEDGPGSRRYNHDLHASPDHKIQCNKTATRQAQDHTVQWCYTDSIDPEFSAAEELEAVGRGRATGNGEFIRNLKLGDVITVWGRARFGGWQNNIKKVELKVYWAAV